MSIIIKLFFVFHLFIILLGIELSKKSHDHLVGSIDHPNIHKIASLAAANATTSSSHSSPSSSIHHNETVAASNMVSTDQLSMIPSIPPPKPPRKKDYNDITTASNHSCSPPRWLVN